LTSAGGTDIFVTKFSTLGAPLWAKRVGGTSSDIGRALAVDDSGAIVVTGYFKGTADFGGGALTSAGSNAIFVAKYAGTDGRYQWAQGLGGTLDDRGADIATDSGGNVVVTGTFADL